MYSTLFSSTMRCVSSSSYLTSVPRSKLECNNNEKKMIIKEKKKWVYGTLTSIIISWVFASIFKTRALIDGSLEVC